MVGMMLVAACGLAFVELRRLVLQPKWHMAYFAKQADQTRRALSVVTVPCLWLAWLVARATMLWHPPICP